MAQAGLQLRSVMDQRPTILITTNKPHNRMHHRITNRVDIMAQTKAISGVSKLALSFGNQKMPIEAGIQSIPLQQDLHPRKMVTESSDKAFATFMRCYVVFGYLGYYDNEWKMGLFEGVQDSHGTEDVAMGTNRGRCRFYKIEAICGEGDHVDVLYQLPRIIRVTIFISPLRELV